ncbi:hypothetical protein PSS09_RS24760 [Escherichia coli]|nr:hypothetical protein [Escherichia coli O113]EKM2186239.1 hypothetical protein [Escherichia coli O113]
MSENKEMMDFDPEIDAMFAAPIEEQVANFIRVETAKIKAAQMQHDNYNHVKAVAKREFLEKCRRHVVGNPVTVMQKLQELIREGFTVDITCLNITPWNMDVWLTPPDKAIRAGIRKAQREAVQAAKLRQQVELKNALDSIQIAAGELYDKLTVQQAIEEQKRRRDALISKIVLGEK